MKQVNSLSKRVNQTKEVKNNNKNQIILKKSGWKLK